MFLNYEVKNQRELAMKTSRIIKYGRNIAIEKEQM